MQILWFLCPLATSPYQVFHKWGEERERPCACFICRSFYISEALPPALPPLESGQRALHVTHLWLSVATPSCTNTSRMSLFNFQVNVHSCSKSSHFAATRGRNKPLMVHRHHHQGWMAQSSVSIFLLWFVDQAYILGCLIIKIKKKTALYCNPEKCFLKLSCLMYCLLLGSAICYINTS